MSINTYSKYRHCGFDPYYGFSRICEYQLGGVRICEYWNGGKCVQCVYVGSRNKELHICGIHKTKNWGTAYMCYPETGNCVYASTDFGELRMCETCIKGFNDF